MSATSGKEYQDIPKRYISTEAPKDHGEGSRVNGKDYKLKKDAFRIRSLGVRKMITFESRQKQKLQDDQFKARLKELKDEKESARKARIDDLKRRREIKAEKDRYARMAATMHAKKVERRKRKEKRNKALKER
ncbi:rRNA-processing protein Cgr1p [Diutina catenulata]